MRIAYITADRGTPVFGRKGASVHIRELAGAFAALGHEVHVLAACLGEGSETLAAEISEVSVAAIPSDEFSGAVAGDPARLARERRYVRVAAAIEARLVELHARRPFDFIYERYSLWSAAGCRAARTLNIPCILEVNAPLAQEQRTYRRLVLADLAEAIESEVFATAEAVVAVSEEVMRYAIGKGANPARTVVIPNAVDLARFNPRVPVQPVPGIAEEFVIGFSGSLKPWHGIQDLLDAFALVHRQSGDCHLLIVGDGPMRPWVEGYVHGAGLRGKVTLTGWTDYKNLPGLLRRMDVAVAPYPAMDSFYFSPLKLFEFLALGRPIVASSVGQIGTVIEDGKTGLLARPGDAADLARKIARLRRDPSLQLALGCAAAQRAHQFTWQGNARNILDLADTLKAAA